MSIVDKSRAVFRAMALDGLIRNCSQKSLGGCDICKDPDDFGMGRTTFAAISQVDKETLWVCTKCKLSYWYDRKHLHSIDDLPNHVLYAVFED